MTLYINPTRIRVAAASAVLFASAALMLWGRDGSYARAGALSTLLSAAEECEGDACGQVTVTFDESRQQYRVQNNSAEHWARVTASNMAASASACLAPGREAYLPLKSISGAYHAAYAEAKCGEEASSGPPSGE